MTTENALRYDNPAGLEGEDSLSAIARLVASRATVLDLGAATGRLGAYLRDRKNCICDGAEVDPTAAALARPWYRKLLQLDLETVQLADHFPRATYDAIVCADVLEHLRDPGRILDQLSELLAPQGRLLISIPNVAYAGIVAGLIAGQFEYSRTGLLDDTHLRFFTRSSLADLLGKHGFRATSIKPLEVPLHRSEFRQHLLEALPPPVLRALSAQPDALAYQFIVEAVPGAGIAPSAEPRLPGPRFLVQLFWLLAGKVDESQSVTVAGSMGEEGQTIELRLPPLPASPSALRLDVSDRPGFIRLRSLALHDVSGASIWTWDGDLATLRQNHEVVRLMAGPMAGALLCTGDDPHFELPLPEEVLARLAPGGTLRAEMSWPLSPDFALAERLINEESARWQGERAALLSDLEGLRAESAALRAQVPELVRQELRLYGLTPGRQAALMARADKLEKTLGSVTGLQGAMLNASQRLSGRVDALEQKPDVRSILRNARRELLPARFEFTLAPCKALRKLDERRWDATDEDPNFVLRTVGRRLPSGWVFLEMDLELDREGQLPPQLYLDTGMGFDERSVVRLPCPENGRIGVELRLPRNLEAIRLDPTDRRGSFRLSRVSATELGKVRAGLRFAAPLAKNLVAHPGEIFSSVKRAWSVLRSGGLGGLREALVEASRKTGPAKYDAWIDQFDRLRAEDLAAIAERIEHLPARPRFSIVMPVYNTPEKWLRRAIESVREQLYPDWELCIADDASTKPGVRQILERAAGKDPRIKIAFLGENGHISAASNSALDLATGDYVALLDHDDELAPQALYMLAEEIGAHPDADFIYSDEDKMDEFGGRYQPYFKPDWNPDLLSSQNYFGHLSCLRTSLAREVGGFRAGCEGSQDYDLFLRVTARCAAERIRHVPHVLYHWRAIHGSTAAVTGNKDYAVQAAMRALRDRYPGCTISEGPFSTTYRVQYPLPAEPPLVSLIIPTRDGYALLERAVRTILEKTTYPRFELLILDNQSTDPATLEYLETLQRNNQARVIRYDAPFNYSAINNLGVRKARGEVVGLINNDVEVIEPEWLTEMVSQALRPGIGAVGCMLLYPDDSIQHAGVILGLFGVGGHVFRQIPRDAPGYFSRAQVVQDLSCCTAACLVLRKKVYEQAGGLDEQNLRIAFNDVDFCMRVAKAGYRNLYTPYALLYHHESASRGLEDTPEKQARFQREIAFMKEKWGTALEEDPAYNPNLSLTSLQMELAWPPRAPKPWKS